MKAYNRNQVFAAACMGMLVFGIVMTTLGAILPLLTERFGIDKSQAGSLLLLLSVGMLAGSVVFGPIVDRYGYKNLLALSAGIILLGLEGIAFAPRLGILQASVALIGLGGGIINGGTNALVSDVSEEGRSAGLSILGMFFGFGALGIPFMLGFLLDLFSYTTLVSASGSIVVLLLAYITAVRFPAPKNQQSFPVAEAFRLARNPALLLFGLFLFFQSGMEMTAAGWTATFFHEVLRMEPAVAVLYLSLYWVGIILARLVMGSLLKRIDPGLVLRVSLLIGLVGAVMLVMADGAPLAAVGVSLVGIGLAAGFPVVLGYVGDLYPDLTGTAFGIMFVLALAGGSVMPYVTGVLGEGFGLRSSFLIVPVSLVVMIAIQAIAGRQLKN